MKVRLRASSGKEAQGEEADLVPANGLHTRIDD